MKIAPTYIRKACRIVHPQTHDDYGDKLFDRWFFLSNFKDIENYLLTGEVIAAAYTVGYIHCQTLRFNQIECIDLDNYLDLILAHGKHQVT
jgi:hypothetical protein